MCGWPSLSRSEVFDDQKLPNMVEPGSDNPRKVRRLQVPVLSMRARVL
jgi:hypothetical protein